MSWSTMKPMLPIGIVIRPELHPGSDFHIRILPASRHFNESCVVSDTYDKQKRILHERTPSEESVEVLAAADVAGIDACFNCDGAGKFRSDVSAAMVTCPTCLGDGKFNTQRPTRTADTH